MPDAHTNYQDLIKEKFENALNLIQANQNKQTCETTVGKESGCFSWQRPGQCTTLINMKNVPMKYPFLIRLRKNSGN